MLQSVANVDEKPLEKPLHKPYSYAMSGKPDIYFAAISL